MLRTKMVAADFIDLKVRELKRERDYLNGRIGCMQSWFNKMKRNLEDGGPHIPARHEALLMFGPRMYLNLNQIGTMDLKEFKEHRQEILDEYLHLRVPAASAELDYYKQPAAMWREFQDQLSLKKINMHFLKIKIEGLVLLRDRISVGIKFLERLSTARIYMGCGDADFGSFRDIGIGDDMDIDD
ncbi:uncharacterized protein LOC111256215 [Setaria italica]|nr:uncharacterized protein LOC111256215 [Setaria italica]